MKQNNNQFKEIDALIMQLERYSFSDELELEQILYQTKDDFQNFIKSFGFNSER